MARLVLSSQRGFVYAGVSSGRTRTHARHDGGPAAVDVDVVFEGPSRLLEVLLEALRDPRHSRSPETFGSSAAIKLQRRANGVVVHPVV